MPQPLWPILQFQMIIIYTRRDELQQIKSLLQAQNQAGRHNKPAEMNWNIEGTSQAVVTGVRLMPAGLFVDFPDPVQWKILERSFPPDPFPA